MSAMNDRMNKKKLEETKRREKQEEWKTGN